MRIQIGKRAKKLLLCICFALCSFVFLAALDFNRLLAGYAENDIELKELDVKLRRALLAEQKTVGENTVNLSLSTGTMTFTADGKNTSVSVSPEIKLTLPSLNNTEIKAEVPSSLQTADGSVSKSQLSQAGVSLSTDIVSSEKSAPHNGACPPGFGQPFFASGKKLLDAITRFIHRSCRGGKTARYPA